MTTMFEFDYKIWGHGWARAVRHGDQEAAMVASYLTRALDDLLRALITLANGYPQGYVEWCAEPAEYRWRLRREPDLDGLVFEIVLRFPRWEGLPDDEGECLFQTGVALANLVVAITTTARKVRDELGETDYLRRWGEPFPRVELAALERWLAAAPVSDVANATTGTTASGTTAAATGTPQPDARQSTDPRHPRTRP